jgi:hypothetical protein
MLLRFGEVHLAQKRGAFFSQKQRKGEIDIFFKKIQKTY